VDNLPDIRVIISSSSSCNLSNEVEEPLKGRKVTLNLFPISAAEVVLQSGVSALTSAIESFLVYGMYPEILALGANDSRRSRLLELRDDFLFRDIIAIEGIEGGAKIRRLLQLLSFQIGGEISHTKLAAAVGVSRQVLGRYLNILEKSFVIFRVSGFRRGFHEKVSLKDRCYFVDNGILNAVRNNFAPVNARADAAALWKNWLVGERIKRNASFNQPAKHYFWRTYAHQEIDWVEVLDGALSGFKFQWDGKRPKEPAAWRDAYPDASFSVISRETYPQFLLPPEAAAEEEASPVAV